jgi:hypothetical protein
MLLFDSGEILQVDSGEVLRFDSGEISRFDSGEIFRLIPAKFATASTLRASFASVMGHFPVTFTILLVFYIFR